tara:strand:- start:90 stop:596 length:507 start_codon:yes stop_codon:yes gene_type:complete
MYKYLVILLLFACNDATQPATSSTVSETLNITERDAITLEKLPANFFENLEIDRWEDLKDLQESVERLATLNTKSIGTNLINLRGRTKRMVKSEYPEPFNIPAVKSRVKVLQMQSDKCLYFTRHYSEDSLQGALDMLYDQYNFLINRIRSVGEDNEVLSQVKLLEINP